MKKNKTRLTNQKKIIAAAIIVAVLLIGYVGFFLTKAESNKSPESNSTSNTDTEKPQPEDKQNPSNTDSPTPIETNEDNKGVVEMTTSVSLSDNNVYIRGGINNAVVSDGKCYAKLSGPNSEIIQKETTLLQNPSTTDCKVVIIKTSELTKGRWTVALQYESDSIKGVSSETSFEIK